MVCVWTKTSHSWNKWRCHRCGTNKKANKQTREYSATQLLIGFQQISDGVIFFQFPFLFLCVFQTWDLLPLRTKEICHLRFCRLFLLWLKFSSFSQNFLDHSSSNSSNRERIWAAVMSSEAKSHFRVTTNNIRILETPNSYDFFYFISSQNFCKLTKCFFVCQIHFKVLKHVLQRGWWYMINFST